ncbi:MAG: hypothetical protein P4L53_01380 [Candidatus Obscuribacterales bacterium]|nr:hypothetical protein [Candidatus Obscuribacterales bacterium]
MNKDDALAAAGTSNIFNIQLTGSGIMWGPESTMENRRRAFADRSVTREQIKMRSYIKGPVRITSDYIRFDGPVSCIGTDVTLNARRIVINGVELPARKWREALSRIVQSAASPNRP